MKFKEKPANKRQGLELYVGMGINQGMSAATLNARIGLRHLIGI